MTHPSISQDMTTPEQFMADLSAIYDELIDHDDSINATSSLDGELLTVNDTDSQDVVTDHAITEVQRDIIDKDTTKMCSPEINHDHDQ